MSHATVIGWDVGGAHLKAARVEDGLARQVLQEPCPLWLGMGELHAAMDRMLARLGGAPRHAVTMTGELVDYFPNRRDGVVALVDAMQARLQGPVDVFAGRGEPGTGVPLDREQRLVAGACRLLPADQAEAHWRDVASANWMATAAWVAARVPQALLVDIGSTTTDIVPVRDGLVVAFGHDDYSRTSSDELVYTGVVRTPLMAVAQRVPFEGRWLGLMAEHFATTADVHRLLGWLPAEADQMQSADGQGKSVTDSARRLARMLGRDLDSAGLDDWRRLAGHLAEIQLRGIHDACSCVASRGLNADAPIVGAGVGRFMAQRVAQRMGRPYVEFSSLVPSEGDAQDDWLASCAPAVSLALLASRS